MIEQKGLIITTENTEMELARVNKVQKAVEDCYNGTEQRLPFHGLPHALYVAHYAELFGRAEQDRLIEMGYPPLIRVNLLKPTGIVHDLNHIDEDNYKEMRQTILHSAGYSDEDIVFIGEVIEEEESSYDRKHLPMSWEVACLRDAGVAYQVDPERKNTITSQAYITETGQHHLKLATSIVTRMNTWMTNMQQYKNPGVFYTELAQEMFGQAVRMIFHIGNQL